MYRNATLRSLSATVFVLCGVFTSFGPPRFRSSPSMQFLQDLHVPARMWGVPLILYGTLVIAERTRWVAHAILLLTALPLETSLAITLFDGQVKNLALVAFTADLITWSIYGLRTSALLPATRRPR